MKKQDKIKKPINKANAKGGQNNPNMQGGRNRQVGTSPKLQQDSAKPQPKKAAPNRKPKQPKKPAQKQSNMLKQEAAAVNQELLQKPVQPISGSQKRAYDKAVNSRSKKGKKRGSRGGNYSLYYILAGIIAVIVFVVLAKTVLFNLGNIEVRGNVRYSAEEIISASGLKTGVSLLDISEDKAEQGIVGSLSYVDSAKVSKSFPTKMIIDVVEAERWYQVRVQNKSYLVSRLGKIVEQGVDNKLPVIIGFEAVEPEVGGYLKSGVESKESIPEAVLSAAETAGVKNITSVDVTDRFAITVLVDNRITLELGNINELESKMYIARELIATEISDTESVTVTLTHTDKVYVRDNNIIDNPDLEVPELPADNPESGSSDTSDSSGTVE